MFLIFHAYMYKTRSVLFVTTLCAVVGLFLAQPILALAASTPGWKIVASPNASVSPISNNILEGVAAVSDSNVWAVGNFNSTDGNVIDHTLIEHWNGTAWSVVSSPDVGTMGSKLQGVSADTSTDAWAVGTVETSGDATGNRTLIEHWNGTTWSVIPSPNPSIESDNLTGVVALSTTNAWAVGWFENNAESALQPIILHWNGTIWSLSPTTPNIGMIANAITARSATDIWVVGNDDNQATNVALHFDGKVWSITPTADFPSSQQIISGVAAPASNDAWMIGSFAAPAVGSFLQPLAIHWNGKTWSFVATPHPSAFTDRLFGVAAISTSDVWAVGQANTPDGLNLHTLIEHWNGKQWSIVASPNNPATGTAFDVLFNVVVSGPASLWTVGGFDNLVQGNPGERTLTMHNAQG